MKKPGRVFGREQKAEFPAGASTSRQRGFIRANLESELKQIDKLVIDLFA